MFMCFLALAAQAWQPGDEEQARPIPATLRLEAAPEEPRDGRLAPALGREPQIGAEEDQDAHGERHGELPDLTLFNFFTEGWDAPWVHRHRKTPDMALLRVTTNFLERELRLDYQGTRHVDGNAKVQRTDFLNSLIAYGVDRRLMVEVVANYQWNHKDGSNVVDGTGAAVVARFQVVDTEESSFAFQMRVSAPNRGIGQTTSTLSPSLAGWQDLDAALGLDRVGFYYSLTWDNLSGPIAPGAKTNTLSYDVTLAKTWTDPQTSVFGNFTTFLEAFAATDLDGQMSHHTALSLTPGIRLWFVHDQSLTLGVDLPASYPHPYSEVFRITYILNF